MKIYSNLSHLKLRIPIMHRQFLKILSQNRDYVQTQCNDRKILFTFHVRQGLKIVRNFIVSILFLIQHNFII